MLHAQDMPCSNNLFNTVRRELKAKELRFEEEFYGKLYYI
jgi:hypothetical protein